MPQGQDPPPTPDGHGWMVNREKNTISIEWIKELPAPQQLLELISCSCKKGCKSGFCSCFSGTMKCTDVCQCINCENSVNDSETSSDDSWSDSDRSDIKL